MIQVYLLGGFLLPSLFLILFLLIRNFQTLPKYLLGGIVFFAFMSFLIRPYYFYFVKPKKNFMLGDSRIAAFEPSELRDLLLIVSFQLTAFLIVIALFSSRFRYLEFQSGNLVSAKIAVSLGMAIYSISQIGRIGFLITNQHNGLLKFATLSLPLIIFFTNKQKRRGMLFWLFSIELLWSIFGFEQKKFNLFFLVLLFFIDSKLRDSGPRKSRLFFPILIGVSALPFYFVLQNIRGIQTQSFLSAYLSAAGYNDFGTKIQVYAVALLERFDGFPAVIDAYKSGVGSWKSAYEYSLFIIQSLIPKFGLGEKELPLGQIWTQEVKSRTVPEQFQFVNLAFGPGAEGYIILGIVGTFLFSILFMFIICFSLILFNSQNMISKLFASGLIFNVSIFENGLAAVARNLNLALQVVILFAIVDLFIKSNLRKGALPR